MIDELYRKNIAIIGGGKFCKAFLEIIYDEENYKEPPNVICIADRDKDAEGLKLAKDHGIPITHDYSELFNLENLHIVLELTSDPWLAKAILKQLPAGVKLIDHFQVRALIDKFEVKKMKKKGRDKLKELTEDWKTTADFFTQFTDHFELVLSKINTRSRKIEMELAEHEKTQSQIIEGSTIPTFVLNKDHIVTHWNKALERFTNTPAEDIVGTNKQSYPFWRKKRPTMADVILDQVSEEEMKRLYGTSWRKSALIEGAYEAEIFFPNLGDEGKWCWFTAAPIKWPDGTIVGAIETLWDKTEDKKAEEERELHNKELSTLISVYSALSEPISIDERINEVIEIISPFLGADTVCLFLREDDDNLSLKYHYPLENSCSPRQVLKKNSHIYQAIQRDEFVIAEEPFEIDDDILTKHLQLKSLVYVPIRTKGKTAFAVLRLGSKNPKQFSHGQKQFMELIGNRLGVAIENAMLQEQYIKSEKKYRSLFNNNPNPIFILNSDTFAILDTNQRAKDCYGYSTEEFTGMPFLQLSDEYDEELMIGFKHISFEKSILFSKKKHYKKGGESFYVNINVSHAKYGKENVLIVATTDITESVEKETQLIQAGKMTTLGVMAAGMAHEINQPLNVIQVCADFFLKMLKKGKPIKNEDLESMTNDIVSNVERATGVIKHVRDFARQSDVVRTKLNINDPIKDVFKVLGHQLKMHQIDVELNLDPELPFILAEHNRLEQVFINLVTNAIDALDEKAEASEEKIEKRLEIETFAIRNQVIVHVTDTGCGMSNEVANKILEPFFTTKKIGKGTGLGVSISYGIVQDYDGTIDIESAIGEGTTFILKFPALEASG